MESQNVLESAIKFSIECGKINSQADIDLEKCTIGVDSIILRNSNGVVVSSISKRLLKEVAENEDVAKLKDNFANQQTTETDSSQWNYWWFNGL